MGQPDAELAYEQERNKDYILALGRQKVYRVCGDDPRALSSDWGALVGRVSMTNSPEDDVEFYVGPRAAKLSEDVRVVSWVNPAAQALLGSATAWMGQQVRVKRRFYVRGHHVTGYWDAWVRRDGRDAFPVLEAERTRPRPRPNMLGDGTATGAPEVDASIDASREVEQRRRMRDAMLAGRHGALLAEAKAIAEQERLLREDPRLAQALAVSPDEVTMGSTPEDELAAVLSAPRGRSLRSILPTLQPSQFEAVTCDPSMTHVLAGPPGTGKTVIVIHRAAWLAHGERRGALDYVLVVGPTDGWAGHVADVINALGEAGRIEVRSLAGLFNLFLETEWIQPSDKDDYMDTDRALGDAILSITRQPAHLSFGNAYERLRNYRSSDGSKPDLDRWCRALPASLNAALKMPRLWPALTLLKIRTDNFERFQHVVVDEAQDLRPLEWMVLRALNAGQWTIAGDLNQRRTAFTPANWGEILGHVGVSNHRRVELTQGFRTTQRIIDFASRLLEKRDRVRTMAALGLGELPQVVDARERRLTLEAAVFSEVKRLAKKHPQGRLAVISQSVRDLGMAATRAGWRRGGTEHQVGTYRLVSDNAHPVVFHLLDPNQARGLEFDAVVVAEPYDFPTRLGQFGGAGMYGPLYTSLTRANLSLSVVHYKPLPRPLVDRH